MALIPGSRLGPNEVTALLGEGGMGQVYRATDTNLKRQVAIKVLPASLAGDSDRLARFQREAEVLAALNHPHIAAIYGLERMGDMTALVMELVEGEDLSQRIAKGAIPIDEALPIARQIAEALEAAHEQGIIHRDLKPANIKVRADGTVKVLDFGLAKAMDPPSASSPAAMNSPTTTSPAVTQAGMILGTAAYMAPEQARGKAVDKRADIWAFGAVLYEMLTARRAFGGEDVSDTLANVLKTDPAWERLPADVPARIRQVLRYCLQREAKQRLGDMQSVRLALEGAFDAPHVPQTMGPPATAGRSRLAWMVAAGLATALLAVLSIIHFREAPPATPLVQTEMPLPDGVVPRLGALSPDGTRLVVQGTPRGGRPQLYLRSLAGRAFAPIPGSETSGRLPFWSPDSQWIAFSNGGKLLKWNVSGGQPPQVVCSANADYGTWGDGDVILFNEEGKPIQRVPAAGGAPRNALQLDTAFGEVSHTDPFFLPGGKAFLFGSNGAVRGARFFATLDGTVRRRLPDNQQGTHQWVANPSGGGFLAYTSGLQLFMRPFNPTTGEFGGEAMLLVDDVVNGPSASFGGSRRLVYVPVRTPSTQLRWYGRDGQPGDTVGEPGVLADPRLSPDGTRLVFTKQDSGRNEIWVLPAGDGAGERIASTGSGTRLVAPLWTPDGRIVYGRSDGERSDVIERPADALGSDRVVASGPNSLTRVRSISTDGKTIALTAGGGGMSESLLLSLPGGAIRPANLPVSSRGLALAPNGRWLVYSTAPNFTDVLVRAVPEDPNAPLPTGERQLASIPTPIQQIQWSADASEIFVLAGAAQRVLMALSITWTDGTPRPGALHKMFDAPRASSFATVDGRRFLFAESVGETGTASAPMVLVQNWPALLPK